MKKAKAHRMVQTIMYHAGKGGLNANQVAALGFMTVDEAKKALHSIWLRGEVERYTIVREYHYRRKDAR